MNSRYVIFNSYFPCLFYNKSIYLPFFFKHFPEFKLWAFITVSATCTQTPDIYNENSICIFMRKYLLYCYFNIYVKLRAKNFFSKCNAKSLVWKSSSAGLLHSHLHRNTCITSLFLQSKNRKPLIECVHFVLLLICLYWYVSCLALHFIWKLFQCASCLKYPILGG